METKFENLVEIALESIESNIVKEGKYKENLEKEGIKFDGAADFIARTLSNLFPGVGSCMFIHSAKDYGLKGCPQYRKTTRKDTLCNAKLANLQRLVGGEFVYHDKENGKLAQIKIPSVTPCDNYKGCLTKILEITYFRLNKQII